MSWFGDIREHGFQIGIDRSFDPHHGVHQLAVTLSSREGLDKFVPMREVIVDATTNQSEHITEGGGLGFNHRFGSTHHPSKLDIDEIITA